MLTIFLAFTTAEASSSSPFDCGIIERTSSEKLAFDEVKKAFNDKKSFDLTCLEYACSKHFFNMAEFLIEQYYSKNDIDTMEVIENQIALLKRKQSKLYKDLARQDKEAMLIKPAFKWAQSLDNIFIETKFSHRLDAPSCIDILDQKIKITEKYLNLTAKCRRGDDTLHYSLFLNFYDNVNVTASSWEKQSMGRIYIHLKKKIYPNRWTKLFMNTEDDDKPGRVQLWKEMHEKYEKSLQTYANQFREEEDDYDDFDYFVAREEGRHIEPKMKPSKVTTETFKTVDVKDQIQSVDVTEEMRDMFNRPGFKEKLMNGYTGPGEWDEYEEYDDDEYEDYEHEERDDYYEWDDEEHTEDL